MNINNIIEENGLLYEKTKEGLFFINDYKIAKEYFKYRLNEMSNLYNIIKKNEKLKLGYHILNK